MDTVILLAAAVIAPCLYFLPFLVAANRRVRLTSAVFLVNLLFGWTLAGWLACMLWGALGQTEDQVAFYKRLRP